MRFASFLHAATRSRPAVCNSSERRSLRAAENAEELKDEDEEEEEEAVERGGEREPRETRRVDADADDDEGADRSVFLFVLFVVRDRGEGCGESGEEGGETPHRDRRVYERVETAERLRREAVRGKEETTRSSSSSSSSSLGSSRSASSSSMKSESPYPHS